jgi:hypothetical protein
MRTANDGVKIDWRGIAREHPTLRRLPEQSNVGWRSDAASPGELGAGSSQCVGLEPGRKVITSPRDHR